MKLKKKKMIAVVAAMLMALSMAPASVFAATSVDSLSALQTAIAGGETEITLTKAIEVSSGDVVIEASAENPVTITADVVDAFTVTGGSLTLGDGIIVKSDRGILWAEGGTIIIDGAEIENTSNSETVGSAVAGGEIIVKSGSLTSVNNTVLIAGYLGYGTGTVTLEGGTVKTAGAAGYVAIHVNSGTLNMKDGTVEAIPGQAVAVENGGVANIEGGIVKGGVNGGIFVHPDSSVKITGNPVISGGDGQDRYSGIKSQNLVVKGTPKSISVSGGDFSDASANGYLADGYVLFADWYEDDDGNKVLYYIPMTEEDAKEVATVKDDDDIYYYDMETAELAGSDTAEVIAYWADFVAIDPVTGEVDYSGGAWFTVPKGKSIEEYLADSGEAIADPAAGGYTFAGWYAADGYTWSEDDIVTITQWGDQADMSAVPDSDVIYFSKWEAAHQHTYNGWKSDADGHWNECACGYKAEKAKHVDENKDGKCDVCGYTMPNDGAVASGDDSNMTLFALLLMTSLTLGAMTILSRKKRIQ